MNSCNPYKSLNRGEHLVEKVLVEFDFKDKKEKKEFYSNVAHGDVYDIAKQKPNAKLLGLLKFHLRVYTYGSKKDSKFRKWLTRIGEPPVLLDTQLVRKSREQMVLYLKKNGYFTALGSDSVVYHTKRTLFGKIKDKKKATVLYKFQPQKAWSVKKVGYNFEDDSLVSPILAYSKSLSLKRGVNYNEYNLTKDRADMERFMKNNGYYNFSKRYVNYKVDTNLNKHAVHFEINILNPKEKKYLPGGKDTLIDTRHKQYYIKDVFIKMDQRNPISTLPDTLPFQGYKFLNYSGNILKPKIIARSIFFRPGELYSLQKVEYSYSRLSALGVFKVINIDVYPDPDNPNSDQLYATITLSMNSKYSITFQTEGTNRGGNLGVNARLNFTNKNTFKGAEALNIGVFGGLEAQKINDDLFENQIDEFNTVLPFNTLEYGADISLKIPDLLIPKKSSNIPKYLKPSTEVSSAYNYQFRGSYNRDVFNVAYGYHWFLSRKHGFTFYPIDLSFVRIVKDTAFENKLQATGNSLLINSYQDHLISSSRLEYTFTNQESYDRNYLFFKSSIESAGNLLRTFDDAVQPNTIEPGGYYTKLGIRYAQYVKLDGDIRKHNFLTQYTKLVYRIYGGVGVPLTNLDVLPFEKSFFGGGANTNRAWIARTMGPGGLPDIDSLKNIDHIGDLSLEGNIEYRFYILSSLQAAFFVDAGNVWLRKKDELRPNAEFNVSRFYKELAIGTGFGLRFDLDFFVIRGDFGLKTHDPSLAPGERWIWQPKPTYKIWNNTRYRPRINFNLAIGFPF